MIKGGGAEQRRARQLCPPLTGLRMSAPTRSHAGPREHRSPDRGDYFTANQGSKGGIASLVAHRVYSLAARRVLTLA
jgi:hypothetical protein